METKKNNLPQSWCVRCNGEVLYRETVIKYLNETYHKTFMSESIGTHYGVTKTGKADWFSTRDMTNEYFSTILTLQEFIELSKPIKCWTPTIGELIEVSNNNENWYVACYINSITPSMHIACYSDMYNEIKNNESNVATVGVYNYIRQKNIIYEFTSTEVFDIIANAKGINKSQIKIIE